MANYVLPMVARKRREYPYWSEAEIAAGQVFVKASDSEILAVNQGLVLFGGSSGDTYIPIASNLTANKIEVLVKLEKIHAGDKTYGNTGGAIIFRPTAPEHYSGGYQFCLASGTSNSITIYNYTLATGFENLSAGFIDNLNGLNRPLFMRARVDNGALSFKVWFADTSEPTAWSIMVTNTKHDVTNIGFLLAKYNQVLKIHGIAYATNGDTATFDLPPVVDVMAGTVANVEKGDIVNIHDVATHNIVDSIVLPSSGTWTSKLYNNRPVYARIERASGSEYDLLFAKYGGTYLGGDYPDGTLKDDGVPSVGEVSVLYKSDDPILGGATIAKVSAPQSGEWRVSGLQPNVPFDVVARKPNRKDTVVSGVMGVPDPSFKFALMGGTSHVGGYLKGFVFAKGATPPLTAQFTGATPYGMDASAFTIDGNTININTPMRDYGQFNFEIAISDSNGNTMSSPVVITDGERAPFVDFVGAVNSMDRNSGSAPMTAVIPSTVQEGDILVLVVMRRGNITVSDNNSGTWILGADSIDTTIYNQGTSIYYRTAKADDVGKTITVSAPYSGRLIVYLSVYRGKFAPLMVKSGRSGPVRYDSTYSSLKKNLEPIPHSSGFLIRAVSNVYAISSDNGLMEVSNMTPTGPAFGAPYRLQVAYAHLSEPGTLISTYSTESNNVADVTPEGSIILDEIRP